MLQLRDGQADVASTLARRNFERVSRFIARVVRDRRPVEDLTQDVFVQVLSHARSYEPRAKFSTWLYRIATNVALNYLKQANVRRRSPGPIGSGDDELDVADKTARDPQQHCSDDEVKWRVSEAIGALPPKQRVALLLFQYEGLTYEQIASVLGVTVESVRSLLMRARVALRMALQGLA